jgi:hypothetical protein
LAGFVLSMGRLTGLAPSDIVRLFFRGTRRKQVILKKGQGTVTPFAELEPKSFEERMVQHPKVLFRF